MNVNEQNLGIEAFLRALADDVQKGAVSSVECTKRRFGEESLGAPGERGMVHGPETVLISYYRNPMQRDGGGA